MFIVEEKPSQLQFASEDRFIETESISGAVFIIDISGLRGKEKATKDDVVIVNLVTIGSTVN